MVTPALERHFRERGVGLIPLEVGAARFVEELDGAGTDVMTVVGADAGEGALGGGGDAEVTLAVRVDAASHGFLADHAIAGVPVVPVVLAAEWLVRAARACRPDLVCAALKELKVLRGIKLEGFKAGAWLTAHARQISNGRGALLALELRGLGGALHYSAMAEMSDRAQQARATVEPARGDALSRIYGGPTLFHGPRFQVIRGVEELSDASASATLGRTAELGWGGERWLTDPGALDGALQLALLWAARAQGGRTLPMAIAELRLLGAAPDGALRARLRRREVKEARALSDVTLVDAAGAVFAELVGIETVLIPSTTPEAQPKA